MAYVKTNCSRAECDNPTIARGLCKKHYYAARKRGELPESWSRGRPETREEMFWRSVEKTDGCWLWQGAISSAGYGIMGRRDYAHRVAYEIATGQSARGFVIDHICHAPRCVNPDHLRRATQKQNTENLSGAKVTSKSGVRGVWYVPRRGVWAVQVTHNYKRHSGGHHATLEQAEQAAIELRNRLFTHNDVDREAS